MVLITELLWAQEFEFRLFGKKRIGFYKNGLIADLILTFTYNDLPPFDDGLLDAVLAFNGMQCVDLLDACKLAHEDLLSLS